MRSRNVFRFFLVLTFLLVMAAPTGQAGESRPDQMLTETVTSVRPEAAVGSAFTYQGLLNENSSPVSANCDFEFSLWNAATGGTQVGSSVNKLNVGVSKGLFKADLDFGEAAFLTGEARWLQTLVRCPTGGGSYTTLTPRQALTTTPYALYTRGVWDFGATGSLRAGTPLGNGPGWTFMAANGNRRDIVGSVVGLHLGVSSDGGAAPVDQFALAENGNIGIGTYNPANDCTLLATGFGCRTPARSSIWPPMEQWLTLNLRPAASSSAVWAQGTMWSLTRMPRMAMSESGLLHRRPNSMWQGLFGVVPSKLRAAVIWQNRSLWRTLRACGQAWL